MARETTGRVQAYYDDLWEQLPGGLEPPDLAQRRAFLLAHVEAGARVLDLGSGEGAFTAALAEAGARPVGVEVAARAVERARAAHPGLEFRHVPIAEPLPFEDASFDVVWVSEVLEHVADTARFLSEVRRVLAPGGLLLVTTPAVGRLRALLTWPPDPRSDHLRFYTARSLRELLGEFGFEVVELRRERGSLHAAARRASALRGSA
jgi:SAM-dependent methyltransferase